MKQGGVYIIKNVINNKFYIGSSFNIINRWESHIRELKKNKHKNKYLQRAWNKYGEENFKFEILELIEDTKYLLNREQYWIDKLHACKLGYNLCPIAGSTLGIKLSKETKEKISKVQKGKKLSEETKQKISKSSKSGTSEVKEKISEKLKGRIVTDKMRKATSEYNKNRIMSDETKQKIKDTLTGQYKYILNEDQLKEINKLLLEGYSIKELSIMFDCALCTITRERNKLSEDELAIRKIKVKERKYSKEVREKISKATKNKPKSEEHKRKLSNAKKKNRD